MKNIYHTLCLLCCFFMVDAFAQNYKLFTTVGKQGKGIEIKWLSKTPLKNIGFNVYRREQNTVWKKLNETPIVSAPVITEDEFKTDKNQYPNDSTYAMYNELVALSKQDNNADFILYYNAIYNNQLARFLGIYWLDASAENGKNYEYKITRSDNEKELAVSEKISFTTAFKNVAPAMFKGVSGNNKIDFSWEIDGKFIGYNIYQLKNNEPILVNEEPILITTSISNKKESLYRIGDLKNGNAYTYQISGIDYFGNESQLSKSISVTPLDNEAPKNIRFLQANYKDKVVLLSWYRSLSSDVNAINIFRKYKNESVFTQLNQKALLPTDTIFIDKSIIADGRKPYYFIEVIDKSNNKNNSDTITAFIPDHIAPQNPQNATFRIIDNTIQINWSKNTESDLAGYRIYSGLKDDDENTMLLLNSKPQLSNSFIDSFPKVHPNKIIYKISAVDNAFNESAQTVVMALLPDNEAPTAPKLFPIVLNNKAASINWSANKEEDIKGFSIYRKKISDAQFEKINLESIALTNVNYIDATIDINAIYQYALKAVDSAGNESLFSNIELFNPINSDLSTNTASISARYDKTSNSVQLVIQTGAINMDVIDGFVLYRKSKKSGIKQLNMPSKTNTFTDTSIQENKTYEYYVKVFYSNGDISNPSTSVIVETK
ncbi:MAG: hypothetical protein R2807_11300 [Chitinophagales bacterium]